MNGSGTLLLRLEGPLQSWGYRSRFKIRETALEPTKSGVIGLLCCALGRDRAHPPVDLAALEVHVRVDRSGKILRDFHTAGGGTFRGSSAYFAPTSSGSKGKNPVITERDYLQDASFVIAISGDARLVETLGDGVKDPVWPLGLGRRSCPPAVPVFLTVTAEGPQTALRNANAAATGGALKNDENPRFVWEVQRPSATSEARSDVPLNWPNRLVREYGTRFVQVEVGEWPR